MTSEDFSLDRIGDLTVITPGTARRLPARVAFSTRMGGGSARPYESLNLGFHVGDDPQKVLGNRRRLLSAVGLDISNLICAEQVHGCVVKRVGSGEAGRGAVSHADSVPGADALVTNEPRLVLGLFFADCVPIVLVDPARRAVGLAHAGRQGVYLDIARAIVESMRGEFGSDPGDLRALIGPSIERDCYEIDESTARLFAERYPAHIGAVLRGRRLDLPGLAARQLLSAGLSSDNVAATGLCTRCRGDLFFSHRGEGPPTGRQAALVALLEEPLEWPGVHTAD